MTCTSLLFLILPARILSSEDLPEPGGPNSRHMRPCIREPCLYMLIYTATMNHLWFDILCVISHVLQELSAGSSDDPIDLNMSMGFIDLECRM